MTSLRLALKSAGLLLLLTAALCALALAWGVSRHAPLLAAQIVYESTPNSDIYLIDVDFPKAIDLIHDPDWLEVMPSWSPDGRLAYISIWPSRQINELRLYDLAAQATEAIRLPLLNVDSALAWSPEGHLSFVGASEDGLRTLYAADSAGGNLRDVTPWAHNAVAYPVWLSDSEIAFVADTANAKSQVVLLNVGTGIWQTISDSRMINVGVVASPADRAVIFHGYNPGRIYSDEWNTYLWTESGGRVRVTTDESFAGSIANSIRDGQVLIVKTVNGTADVYLYEIETRSLRNLTQDSTYETRAVWSPDGRIAYIANRDGEYGIYLLNPATGNKTELLRLANTQVMGLAWSHGEG